ncbi:hypothetical protein [Micromonospora globbae]|uniref:hypothetical protein n=1 Tax=Micromonospora globbae TaxID=1894969 RepID=UPI00342B0F4A
MHDQPSAVPPVFVDRTGRRRRLAVIGGTVMGLGLLTSIALILAGLLFEAPVPVPGWPDSRPAQPVEAGVDGRDGFGHSPSTVPSPDARTGTPTTTPPSTADRSPGPALTRSARPARSDHPGQGDERRPTPRPSRSPGKPT